MYTTSLITDNTMTINLSNHNQCPVKCCKIFLLKTTMWSQITNMCLKTNHATVTLATACISIEHRSFNNIYQVAHRNLYCAKILEMNLRRTWCSRTLLRVWNHMHRSDSRVISSHEPQSYMVRWAYMKSSPKWHLDSAIFAQVTVVHHTQIDHSMCNTTTLAIVYIYACASDVR